MFRAPANCVQYFTGTSGNVQSYGFAGGQLLTGMNYQNCIRTEDGYCGIEWKQSSTTSPGKYFREMGVGAKVLKVVKCFQAIFYT